MHESLGLVTLAVSLLGTLIVSTWRFSSLAATLLESIRQLQRKDEELDARLKALDSIPQLETRVGYLEKNHSIIPRIAGDVEVLKTQAQHSKEMRRVFLRSRPDEEE